MDFERFDWDKMRVFRVVAELGSMNATATRLGESAPTIGRKIDDLERALNAVLFVRSRRGVELTAAGRRALRYANAMADAAEGVSRDVAGADTPLEGPVKLAAGDGLGAHWIAPRLPVFHRAHPKVQLQLRFGAEVPDVLGGEADIAIQFSRPTDLDLVARKLGVLHYMCFASQDYLDTYGGPPSSIFEFYDHRLIFHTGYVNQLESWAPKTVELKRIVDFAVLTNSGAAMMAVCASGGGIAILPSYVASLDRRLVALDLPELAPIQFWLTYTERIGRMPRGQAVIQWLRSIFDPQKIPWFREAFHHPNAAEFGSGEVEEEDAAPDAVSETAPS